LRPGGDFVFFYGRAPGLDDRASTLFFVELLAGLTARIARKLEEPIETAQRLPG